MPSVPLSRTDAAIDGRRSTALRAGVIGCGRMGRIRAEHLHLLGCRVAVVHDADPRASDALAAGLPGCRAVHDEADIPWDALDLVVLATPPGVRRSYFEAAIAHGAALFLEKPIGLDAASWAALSKRYGLDGRVVGVGYMNRCRPSVRAAREWLRDNPPLTASAHWIGGRYNVPWWPDERLSGGPLNEQAGHLVDLLRYLVGEIAAVQCKIDMRHARYNGSAAVLTFRTGAVGTLLHGCDATAKSIGLHVFGSDGTVRLKDWQFDGEMPDGTLVPGGIGEDRNGIFLEEMRRFLEAVRAQDASMVPCHLSDAIRTQAVLDALRASARTLEHHVVDMPDATEPDPAGA